MEHTWAEIEHKKNYKANSNKSLPEDLQRRLMVLAGALELIDRELSNIALAADEYAQEISNHEPNTLDDSISILSLTEILRRIKEENDDTMARIDVVNLDLALLELNKFGTTSNRDLDKLLRSYTNSSRKIDEETTEIGFIRDAMIHEDASNYFRNGYGNSFGILLSDLPSMTKILGLDDHAATRDFLGSLGVEIINAYDDDPGEFI